MLFRDIRWTEWSEEHIAGHGVSVDEVEQALRNRPIIVVSRDRNDHDQESELVYGATDAGRLLLVVLNPEDDQGMTFIVTARDMTDSEKRSFRKRTR